MRTSRSRSLRRPAALAAAAAAALALAGCSASAAEQPAAAAGTLPSAHVHAAAFDPADGTLLLATHDGLVQVGSDGKPTQVGPVIDLMGFAVTGPDHYLASGHPGAGVDLPNPVGLIESTDGGRTWTPLSRQGQSDFHALTAGAAGILGYDDTLRHSTDGGAWAQRSIPADPHALAAAPDGATVLATTEQGPLRSTDAGATWAPLDGAPLLAVVGWADDTTAVGDDPAGTVWVSTDTAGTWQQRDTLGGAPHAVAATTAGDDMMRVVVVTGEGVHESRDGAQTFRLLLAA